MWSTLTKAAVRSARRRMAVIDAAYAEAYARDSQVDAGEWSGPALGRAQDAANWGVVDDVARRYGVAEDSIWHLIGTYEMKEQHHGM